MIDKDQKFRDWLNSKSCTELLKEKGKRSRCPQCGAPLIKVIPEDPKEYSKLKCSGYPSCWTFCLEEIVWYRLEEYKL